MIFKMIHPIKNYRTNKLSKHLGLIYKTKNYLNKKSFGKSVLFLHRHTSVVERRHNGAHLL